MREVIKPITINDIASYLVIFIKLYCIDVNKQIIVPNVKYYKCNVVLAHNMKHIYDVAGTVLRLPHIPAK